MCYSLLHDRGALIIHYSPTGGHVLLHYFLTKGDISLLHGKGKGEERGIVLLHYYLTTRVLLYRPLPGKSKQSICSILGLGLVRKGCETHPVEAVYVVGTVDHPSDTPGLQPLQVSGSLDRI